MKLIVGLGNPGKKYETSRHNVGFKALDFVLAALLPGADPEKKADAYLARRNSAAGEKLIFAYPQTFMNSSGAAVSELCRFYKLNPANDLLVLHDDVDLPLGAVKFTADSSAAGHKGVQSIINALGTQNFRRIRIGVETRPDKTIPPTDDFVLQNFSSDERATLGDKVWPAVREALTAFLGGT